MMKIISPTRPHHALVEGDGVTSPPPPAIRTGTRLARQRQAQSWPVEQPRLGQSPTKDQRVSRPLLPRRLRLWQNQQPVVSIRMPGSIADATAILPHLDEPARHRARRSIEADDYSPFPLFAGCWRKRPLLPLVCARRLRGANAEA